MTRNAASTNTGTCGSQVRESQSPGWISVIDGTLAGHLVVQRTTSGTSTDPVRTSAITRTPASSRRYVSASSSGSTRVCPTTGMKFVSPLHRGTTCQCRCPGMPAPAIAPEVQSHVEPGGLDVRRIAASDRCSRAGARRSPRRDRLQVPDVAKRHHQQVSRVVGELVQDHVRRGRRGRGHVLARSVGSSRRRSRRRQAPPSPPGCTASARGSRGDPSPGQPPNRVWVERASRRPHRGARPRRRRTPGRASRCRRGRGP